MIEYINNNNIIREQQNSQPQSLPQTKQEIHMPVFNPVSVRVDKTIINNDGPRPVIQYVLQITQEDREWEVRRKFKEFCDLADRHLGIVEDVIVGVQA